MRDFCRKWKIRQMCVFGSILRNDFRPDSDIDFLADFEEDAEWDLLDHIDMEDELAQMLGRRIDLVTRYSIETSGNAVLKKEILGSAEPILAL
jgi:Predicted nucleotidyltransferases